MLEAIPNLSNRQVVEQILGELEAKVPILAASVDLASSILVEEVVQPSTRTQKAFIEPLYSE